MTGLTCTGIGALQDPGFKAPRVPIVGQGPRKSGLGGQKALDT